MKGIFNKILLLVLVASTLTVFTACDSENKEVENCIHEWQEATCTEAKKCSLCSQVSGSKLGHTTQQGTCSRCGEYCGSKTWAMGEYVDEFKRPTGKKYLYTTVTGEFSNSATTNSELTAKLLITSDDKVYIRLYEYGNRPAGYGCVYHHITMLDTNNNKYPLGGYMSGGEIDVDDDYGKILEALNSTGDISFHIFDIEYGSAEYLFTIETSNFKDMYNQLKS